MEEKLQLRIYGDDSLPTLICLPGLHGDWTFVGGFRKAVSRKSRFVEMTYPRTLDWSLDDYAAAIETALAQNEIDSGWLLGESFGSQPLWAMVGRASSQATKEQFRVEGIILAGGFVKHPLRWAVRLTEKTFRTNSAASGDTDYFRLRKNSRAFAFVIRRKFWNTSTNLLNAGQNRTGRLQPIACI